jgi:hypothetical protein
MSNPVNSVRMILAESQLNRIYKMLRIDMIFVP